jgi:Kef-type K+ transport system membrane component KefB
MPDTGFDNLVIVALVALFAPLAVAGVPSLRALAVVVEIVAGVVLGREVLEIDLPRQESVSVGLSKQSLVASSTWLGCEAPLDPGS